MNTRFKMKSNQLELNEKEKHLIKKINELHERYEELNAEGHKERKRLHTNNNYSFEKVDSEKFRDLVKLGKITRKEIRTIKDYLVEAIIERIGSQGDPEQLKIIKEILLKSNDRFWKKISGELQEYEDFFNIYSTLYNDGSLYSIMHHLLRNKIVDPTKYQDSVEKEWTLLDRVNNIVMYGEQRYGIPADKTTLNILKNNYTFEKNASVKLKFK